MPKEQKPPIDDVYDEEYFQRGVATGSSCYENYRWLPEPTFGMCQSLIDRLPIRLGETVLDYGCSRGYIVKALRILHREAFGCDVSEYAIAECDPDVRQYVMRCDGITIPWPGHFDLCIAKDVLEHVPQAILPKLLKNIAVKCARIFVVVPLAGKDGEFIVSKENWDPSHQIRRDLPWWVKAIGKHYTVQEATHTFPGVKDSYKHVVGGHGFITGDKNG
jgi:SAM-dependent methyltransferase